MPEISFCLFDMKQLFKLLPVVNKEFLQRFAEYEQNAQEEMVLNRAKLFGYDSEFDKCYSAV